MQPTNDTAISRPDLGVVVYEHMQNAPALGYIGTQVMPLFPVAEQSMEYPVIPMEVLLKIPDTKRAMGADYKRGDFEFEMGWYATKENGWEEPLDDRERKLYARLFDAEVVKTKRATGIILRAQEKRIADKVFNATNFTPHAVTNEWDDTANATPIDDVKTGKLAIRSACGMLPNTLIITYSTFLNLKRCDQVVALLKYTFPGIDINKMTAAQLAAVLDVPRVLVAGAVYDSAKKGAAASISDIWDSEYAMLTITSDSQDLSEPCIGRTFFWTEEGGEEPIVESYRDEGRRSDIIRVRNDSDERLICSFDENGSEKSKIYQAVSYLFSNITT